MQNINTRVRCHPFSNAPYVGRKHCCHEMTLVSALVHIFKCHTCLHRRDTPDGGCTYFSRQINVLMSILQITILLHVSFVQLQFFHGTWSKDKAKTHIAECIMKATYNASQPYVCTHCLGHFMVDMTDSMEDLIALLSKYKKVYFLSYQFILSFNVVVNKCNVFVRLNV